MPAQATLRLIDEDGNALSHEEVEADALVFARVIRGNPPLVEVSDAGDVSLAELVMVLECVAQSVAGHERCGPQTRERIKRFREDLMRAAGFEAVAFC